jgi:hypothetical protein
MAIAERPKAKRSRARTEHSEPPGVLDTPARGAAAPASRSSDLGSMPASHRGLIAEIAAQLRRRDPAGDVVARIDDIPQIAALAADRVVDNAAAWEDHLGAFYDGEGVRTLLGRGGEPISRQAVHKRKGLLALTTGSGQIVYPAVQFRAGSTAPGLAEVLAALPEALVSRWTVASWLTTPDPDLDGERPIDLLFESGPEGHAAVLSVARLWAAQLSG